MGLSWNTDTKLNLLITKYWFTTAHKERIVSGGVEGALFAPD